MSNYFTLLLLLLLPVFFLMPSSSFLMAEENPMQQLPEAELFRMAGYGDERLSSVLVTGSLVCEACLLAGSELSISHVQGAMVAVACRMEGRRRRRINYANGTTDEFGDFIVDLPSQLHAMPKLEEACVVRILRIPRNSHCRRFSRGLNPAAKRIRLSSVGNSIRVYTTGLVRTRSLGSGKPSHRECLRKKDIASDLMQTSW